MGLGVARGQESWSRTENALGRNWMVMDQRRAGKVVCGGAEHARQMARRNIKECFKARSPGDGVVPGLGGRWEGSCP